MRTKPFKGTLLAALTIILLMAPATSLLHFSQASAEPNPSNVIVILHTNDFHSHLLPEGDVGGSAYIASIVENERKQYPGRVLLLDAGDIIDGAPIGDLFYGRSVIEVMNAMGYDAMTVGNHELGRYGGNYTYGVFPIENDYLMDLKATAEFPMLAVNVLINGSKAFQSYVIKEIGGVKIGIIGVTTQFSAPENVTISEPNNVVQQYIDEIGSQVDLVIALTHLGLSSDRTLAYNVGGIDIIVGGHSHTVMGAPQIIGETKIVQAGSYGEYVGRILLEYDAQNPENYNFSYSLIEVRHPPLEENQRVKEIVENYDNIISPIIDVKIGYTEYGLYRYDGLGEMVAESFKECAWTEVGYQNYGGIRDDIPAGDIIIRQIHKALPYGNRLMSMDLQGSHLKSQFYYGYVAGAYQNDSQWYLESGELIENSEYYRVATNDYAGTRYGFTNGVNITYHGLCRDAFIGYIKDFCGPMPLFTHTPFKTNVNESITFIASASIPEWNGTHLFPIVNYTWNFGDGVTVSETDPTVEHAYTAVGNYTITLNATDTQGNWNTTSQVIYVNLVELGLVTLYQVHLELNHWFSAGANLTAAFYSYSGVYRGNTTVWTIATPTWVELSINITHPQGKPIEVVNLVLTDDSGNALQTVTRFSVGQSHLMERLLELDKEWTLAPPEQKPTIFREIATMDLQWPYAPP